MYTVIDIETTGLSKNYHQITEIAAVRVNHGKIIKSYQQLVNPEVKIPAFITRLTGIDNEMVKNSPTIEEVSNLLKQKNIAIKYISKDDVATQENKMHNILQEKLNSLHEERDGFFDLAEKTLNELKLLKTKKEESVYLLDHLKKDIEKINVQICQVKGYMSNSKNQKKKAK
ncbi:MAG: hypothetical protein KJ597_05060 [Nanoarchaeota archaeon]|nr:hypothetical protein [Nanoarchaeota archaeon]